MPIKFLQNSNINIVGRDPLEEATTKLIKVLHKLLNPQILIYGYIKHHILFLNKLSWW